MRKEFSQTLKTRHDIYIEEIESPLIDINDKLVYELEKAGIVLTLDEENLIHDLVFDVLEMLTNGHYRSHN